MNLIKKIMGAVFFATLTSSTFAQEGFKILDKPSAQCSIHLCDSINGPSYAKDGSIVRPIGWESWVFVGSPLTPNALNGGKANFREFHNVYIEPSAFEHYRKTGEFANGTQMVKVRTHLYRGDDCSDISKENGSCVAVSGRGYFNGDYSGFELTVKDKTRFKDPGGWVYLNYGEERPWAPTANPFPAGSCNACHDASAADDFVFTQFYPVLRDNDPKLKNGAGKGVIEAVKKKAEVKQLPACDSSVPVEVEALFAYLQEKKYESFKTRDSEAHPSAGPHLKVGEPVEVFFSDSVVKSLSGDYTDHPKGAAIVKEIYSPDKSKLTGWAVSVKTEEKSEGGKGWFWVEFTSTTDSSKQALPAGNGVKLCTGCHLKGKDFVLSKLPE